MGIILVYSLIIRIALIYFDYNQSLKVMENPEDKYIMEDPSYKSLRNTAYAFLYFPLGLICVSFIFFIIKELIEENDELNRNVIYIMLQSTLSRMGFVSLIFIGISIIVNLSPDGYFGFIRDLLWRLKDNLGLIFLIDILLIRIDLDGNKINMKKQEIEKAKKLYPSNEDIYSDTGRYNCGSTIVNNDYNDYIQIKNYEFPLRNEPDYYDDDIYESNYQSLTTPLRSGFDIKSIISSYIPQDVKSTVSSYVPQDVKSCVSAYGAQDHKSCISTYSAKSIEFAIPPTIKAKNSRKRSGQSLYSNIDSANNNDQNTHTRANSVVLGNKVYSKVPLSPTLSETKSVVSSVFTYTGGSKVSSGNELCVHQAKNNKRATSNILIESDLL